MGKSNKFDYTNRPNSGAKLGHIIGQALQKEADKVCKDAERQTHKSRKAGIGSDSSPNGKEIFVHILDIRAPSKQLSDEGTCALAVGLESALGKGSSLASLALEDLNLSDNGITTKSLAQLAPIIKLAKRNLKSINLSNNQIKVQTVGDARQWEQFLKSFKGCVKLRRLDLSGNPMLGAKALEVLFRVHLAEGATNSTVADGDVPTYTLGESSADNDDYDGDDEATPTHVSTFSDRDGRHIVQSSHTRTSKRCYGLRSIPYLTLKDIDLTDAGALWLSYLIENHHYPDQLIDESDSTLSHTPPKAYRQSNHLQGVKWNAHEAGIGKDGLYLLKQTEAIRFQAMCEEQNGLQESEDLTESDVDEEPEGFIQDRVVDHYKAVTVTRHRRESFRSSRNSDGREYEPSKLGSIRRKIQRNMIAQYGAASVDVWRAALKAVVIYRILMFNRPAYRRHYYGPPLFDFLPHPDNKASTYHQSSPKASDTRADGVDIVPTRLSGVSTQSKYASTLIAQDPDITPGEPELVITDVTNTPRTPKLLYRPHRKGGFSEGSDDLHCVTAKLEGLALAAARDRDDPQRFVRWQEEYQKHGYHSDVYGKAVDAHSNPFRDLRVPSHLPACVIERIADFVLSEEERAAITTKQRERVAAWVRNRSNFDAEREWRRMADSAQAWTLLKSIGCLNYEH